MAGPGGGSSGGGFGGGSFGRAGGFGGSSGGFGGGSFGGTPVGPTNHTPPHHHSPYFRRPRQHIHYGSRFGGGCVTFLLVGLVMIFAFIFLMAAPGSVNVNVNSNSDSTIIYDEATMQHFANDKYQKYFGDSSAPEDNILLVILTNDACDGYYTIAWIGDNINYDINHLFGEYSQYGIAMREHIDSEYFGYSLDSDLMRVVNDMSQYITHIVSSPYFNEESDRSNLAQSKFVNLTSMDLTAELVDSSLQDFTKTTGIPMVIIVDSAEKVFGGESNIVTVPTPQPAVTTSNFSISIIFAVAVVVMILAVVLLVLSFSKKKSKTKKAKEEKPPWES